MVTVQQVGESPSSGYPRSVHGMPARLNLQGSIHRIDGLQSRASPAASRTRVWRSLVATFAAVSAVIFLAYLCSVSTVKRMTALSFSRRLAASLGSEECDESETSSSTDSFADTSIEGEMAMLSQQAYAVGGAHAQSVNTEPTPSTKMTVAYPGESASASSTPHLETQRRQAGLKRKSENQSMGEKTKQLRLQSLMGDTPLPPPPPALDPHLDSLIDSVLSEGPEAFSEAFWLLDDDPMHPIVDFSFGSSPLVWGREQQNLDESAGSTMDVLPLAPSIQPSRRGKPKQQKGDEESLPAGTSGSQMQLGSPPAVEAFHRRPSPDTVKTKDGPRQTRTAETLAPDEENMAARPTQLAASALSSPSKASPASSKLPLGVRASVNSGPAEQSSFAPEHHTGEGTVFYCRWLENLYAEVPERVLVTHPFYRHPEHQPALVGTRVFNLQLAEFLASVQANPNAMLAACREIMMKPSLNQQDFKELLLQTERLYGYAAAKMAVTFRRPQPADAIEVLGTVFLVVDALHCAAEVLGACAMKHLWWPSLARRIEGARFTGTRRFIAHGKCLRNSEIARSLDAALVYYRKGGRPPPRVVIGLKETLLCEPRSSKFSVAYWNPWREAAMEWRRSVQLSLAKNK